MAATGRPGHGLWYSARRIRAAIEGSSLWFKTIVTIWFIGLLVMLIDSRRGYELARSCGLLYAAVFVGVVRTTSYNWRCVIREGVLRPVHRKTLFCHVAFAMGQQMIGTWLGLWAGMIGVWFVLRPETLHDPVAWCALIAAGGFIVAMGGGLAYLWAGHLEAGRVLAACLWPVVLLIAWTVNLDTSTTPAQCLWCGALTLTLGIILMRAAYQRWLRADWD